LRIDKIGKVQKYSATGNTFVIIDATQDELSDLEKEEIVLQVVEDRDGVIFVEEKNTYYFMDYFNRDGKRAAFCGNGSRAFLRFLSENFGVTGKVTIETNAGRLIGYVADEIFVQMPQPEFKYQVPQDEIYGFNGALINVGVPHLVINVGEVIWNFDMELARALRHKFNANVNLFNVWDDKNFEVRTFERGVERETLSCGSGTTATGYFIKKYVINDFSLPDRLTATTKGGILTILFEDDGIYLGGGVENE